MADKDDDKGNVVEFEARKKVLADAFDEAKNASRERKRKKSDKVKFVPPPPPPALPHDCPVKCLGHEGLLYHFLAADGQRISLPAKEIGRLNIIALFGGDTYLIATWPSYDKDGNITGWNHGQLAPLLIRACQEAGLWNPKDKERGVGCWAEDDGTLIFHCGDILVTSKGRAGTGLRGKYLYPSAPRLPEPSLDVPAVNVGAMFATENWGPEEWATVEGPGARVMERLVTWSYARQFMDPILILGDICAALLGAAPGWRPMMMVTGESRCGKSTLLGGLKALIGPDAYISSGNATQAAIARLVSNTTKPVFLDEMERGEKNQRADEVLELLILASSGETLDRGTPGAETNTFLARNCFVLSAISLPGLKQQVLNRVFVIDLQPLDPNAPARIADEAKDEAGDQVEEVWGPRTQLQKLGCDLRARLLSQWPRYRQTRLSYQRELIKQGHDRRSADQFGSALTAFDMVMFNDMEEERARHFATWLTASQVAEVAENLSMQVQFVNYLMQCKLSLGARGGRQMTVSKVMRKARSDTEMNTGEDESECRTALTQIGVKVFRLDTGEAVAQPNQVQRWMVAIAIDHAGMAELMAGTPWYKKAGSTSGWADMLRRLPGADNRNPETGKRRRLRIDGRMTYVVVVPWETLFSEDKGDDDDLVQWRDRI